MKDIDIIFQKKKILVMGLGVTGIPVIRRLLSLGNTITAFDNDTSLDLDKIHRNIGLTAEENVKIILKDGYSLDPSVLDGVSLVIISPGIPSENKLYEMALERGIPVWDELELSWRLLNKKQRSNMIAVTGTNGKTTVVNLIGAILDGSGIANRVCGNVGAPLLDTFVIDTGQGRAEEDGIIRVVEVSSFQLERSYSFRPGIGILLNITSDHMDRHGSMEKYAQIKMKLFSHQDRSEYAIINTDDRLASHMSAEISRREEGPFLIKYGIGRKKGREVWYEDFRVCYDLPPGAGEIDIQGALLKGMHNISNIEAAAAAAVIVGADPENIGRSIKSFRPLSHRMEYLGEISGIRFINDSKSTNPDSIIAALKDFGKEVTLIMGGLDKGMDFTPIFPSINASVNSIVLIGRSAERMDKLFKSACNNTSIYRCSSMEEAVIKGFEVSRKGDVLLLSPGCASMDMFRDYKDRGNRFKEAVMDLKHGS